MSVLHEKSRYFRSWGAAALLAPPARTSTAVFISFDHTSCRNKTIITPEAYTCVKLRPSTQDLHNIFNIGMNEVNNYKQVCNRVLIKGSGHSQSIGILVKSSIVYRKNRVFEYPPPTPPTHLRIVARL